MFFSLPPTSKADRVPDDIRWRAKPEEHRISEGLQLRIALVPQQQPQDFGLEVIQTKLLSRKARVHLDALIAHGGDSVFPEHVPKCTTLANTADTVFGCITW